MNVKVVEKILNFQNLRKSICFKENVFVLFQCQNWCQFNIKLTK